MVFLSGSKDEDEAAFLAEQKPFLSGILRIPGQGEKDSGVNAKSVPGRRRTRFRAEGEQ
jgi:hypothetical protein